MVEFQKMFQKIFSSILLSIKKKKKKKPKTFIPKSNQTFEIIEDISSNQIPIMDLAQEITKSAQNSHNDQIKPNKSQKQPKS